MNDHILCPSCSEPVSAGTRFCAQCGTPVTLSPLPMPVPRPSVRAKAQQELVDRLRMATVNEFEIQHELGTGGMASVFLALDLALGRKVAIKVMSPALLLADDVAVERFKQEARTVAALSHPQIIPIHAVREAEGLLFFVMQFVEGKSLETVIQEKGPLPFGTVQSLLVQVGGALAYAHKRGVVHRDVKPANIMLDDEGWPIIMDFGIAKGTGGLNLTQVGQPLGTPAYMSPEQCVATVVGGSSDQYSLGVVAYEMITGRIPFSGETGMAIMMAHAVDPVPPMEALRPDCPPALSLVVRKMLEKKPEHRYATMTDAVAALRAAPLSAPLSAPPSTQRAPADRPTNARGVAGLGGTPVRSVPAVTEPRVSPLRARVLERQSNAAAIASLAVAERASARLSLPTSITTPSGLPLVHPEPERDPEVLEGSVASVELSSTEPTVVVGERLTLRATMRDAGGHRLGNRSVTWQSSEPRIAKIGDDGTIQVLDRGSVEIGATCEGVSGFATLYVSRVGVHRLAVHPRVGDLSVEDELQLHVDLLDRTGARLGGRVIEWTSTDPAVASVDASGRVYARTEGWTTIIASNSGISASLPIQVHPATIAVFRVIPVTATLLVGETLQCQALAANAQGRVISGVEVSWASGDTSIAAIAPDGMVQALRPGLVKIAAGIRGRRATLSLTVSRGDESAR
jgi:serine/threonine-protein kinase